MNTISPLSHALWLDQNRKCIREFTLLLENLLQISANSRRHHARRVLAFLTLMEREEGIVYLQLFAADP